jgi:hypothetical protein
MHDQVPAFGCLLVAQGVHVLELPGGVHMHQRERRLARRKSLARQMQHHGRILADTVQHDRIFKFRSNFADDVNRLGFQLLEMSQLLLTDVHDSRLFLGCLHSGMSTA